MENECQNGSSPRLQLGEILEQITGVPVHYQPPGKFKLEYPCVIYKRSRLDPTWADNGVYKLSIGYSVTYITKDPDDENPIKIASMPMTRLETSFKADNLYHWTFQTYF